MMDKLVCRIAEIIGLDDGCGGDVSWHCVEGTQNFLPYKRIRPVCESHIDTLKNWAEHSGELIVRPATEEEINSDLSKLPVKEKEPQSMVNVSISISDEDCNSLVVNDDNGNPIGKVSILDSSNYNVRYVDREGALRCKTAFLLSDAVNKIRKNGKGL